MMLFEAFKENKRQQDIKDLEEKFPNMGIDFDKVMEQ